MGQVTELWRWCFLKRLQKLTDKQTVKLSKVLQYNLRTVRGFLNKREFERFLECKSPYRAGRFLDEWSRRVMHSNLEPLKDVAGSLWTHRELLLNWLRSKRMISVGIVEGMNNRVKLTMRKSRGFRTYESLETALYHNLAKATRGRILPQILAEQAFF